MKPLALQSEVYRPEGGIDARSQRRTLGRPPLDFFDLFLRETLQNSWDAGTRDGPVHFYIDAWHMAAQQRIVLKEVVFKANPPQPGPGRISDDVDVLVVTDTGTHGLNGPTRADVRTVGRSNFVDLVRNTGRDPTKGYGGGTYGFGKAVLFEASTCSTVVIYSRTIVDGLPTARFIAMALGDPGEVAGRRYTGRHWWGVSRDGLVEPVEGPLAEALAEALGFTRLPAGTTGTSLMVVAPATDNAPLREVVARLADTATAYAWPHMVPIASRPPDILFTFTCDAETLTPPDPATDPLLLHHVEAYQHCEDLLTGRTVPARRWPWTIEEIRSQRPARRLGVMAYRDYPYTPEGRHDAVPADVALMRSPRFVVRYMPVKLAPFGQATAGVFIAAPELDEDFAKSEPASHDDWRPANLGLAPNQRNPVRQALQGIKTHFQRYTEPVTETQATHRPGTVNLASHLGRMLDGTVTGTDTRISPHSDSDTARVNVPLGPSDVSNDQADSLQSSPHSSPDETATGQKEINGSHTGAQGSWTRAPGAGRRPRTRLSPTARIVTAGGVVAVEFTAEVSVPHGASGAVITAEPYVVVDGGRESDPPTGADIPHVMSWREAATGEMRHGSVLKLAQPGTSCWKITISQPPDTAVSIRLEAREAVI